MQVINMLPALVYILRSLFDTVLGIQLTYGHGQGTGSHHASDRLAQSTVVLLQK